MLSALETFPHRRADILLVIAHPDDEIAWFGGLIPTAVAAGQRIVTLCMTRGPDGTDAGIRERELQQSLHACGVTEAPEWGHFSDCGFIAPGRFEHLEWVWNRWGGREQIAAHLVMWFHRLQPRLVYTHNPETGDYGHPNHQACGWACVDAFDACACTEFAGLHADAVQQVLVCSNEPAACHDDWELPLAAFQGSTATAVAQQALRCHVSQSVSQSTLRSLPGFVSRRNRRRTQYMHP